jgi:hypothetical protein
VNDMLNQLQTGVQGGAAMISPSTAIRDARPPAR